MSLAGEKELREYFGYLEPEERRKIVELARSLAARRTRKNSGAALLRFSGAIGADDLSAMKSAIEAGCEQVALDGW